LTCNRGSVRWLRIGTLAAVLALAVALPDSARSAEQAPYPNRPIRLVVSFSPGGTSDTLARMLSEHLEAAFGQPVVVENRPGASGNLASDLVARAAPDGYTLLQAANGITILPSTHGERAVDPVRAFAPVTKLVTQPILVAINASLPVATLQQLVALAKTEPGRLAYATPGVGTTDHLAAAMLFRRANAELLHVPYASNAAEIKDLVQGEVKVAALPRERSVEGACGHHAAPCCRVPRRAHRGRVGISRIRGHVLVRRAGARRHTARSNRPAAP